ncbi:MAG: pyridoxal kinase [Rhizobiaceae bacterium]
MAAAKTSTKPAVIAISSHVARGSVGNRAGVFALEALGYPAWSVPTVLLPWHPGHGPSTRIVPDDDAFAAFLADLATAPWLGEVGGILTGYLGSPAQAAAIARLITTVKGANPGVVYVCDPVIGDNGGLYVPAGTASAIRDVLLPLADIATPNSFELGWLSGDSQPSLVEQARSLNVAKVLVTSAFKGDETGNLLVCEAAPLAIRHPSVSRPPNGLGDLTSALFLAHKLAGASDGAALRAVTSSVFALMRRSVERGADELTLETDADCLTAPPLDLALNSAISDD